MRNLLVVTLLLFAFGFYTPANAQPPLWSNNFGMELVGLTGCDDCQEAVNFPFPFLFAGNLYSMAYVGTNGCIQLDGFGSDGDIDYDHWSYMEEFLADSDPDNPETVR